MSLIKSHNDYFVRPQLLKALKAGCKIIEIDVIYLNGEVLLSHSFRPFKWMTYGEAEDYFKMMYTLKDVKIYST